MNYSDYQAAVLKNFADQGLTAKDGDYLGEADWNKMSAQQQYDQMLMAAPAVADPQGGPGNTMPQKYLGASPDDIAAFTAKFGAPNGPLDYSVGDPTNYGQPSSQWATDPSRFLTMPDGTSVFEGNNVSGDFLRQAQATDDRTSNQFMTRGAATIGAMALGGQLYGSDPGLLGGEGGYTSPNLFGGSAGGDDWVPSLGEGSAGAPVSDLSTMSGTQAAAPVTDLSTGGSPLQQLLGGNFSGAASGLLSSALSNPLQALGLLQMAHGLVGSHGTTSSTTSGSSKPAGGAGVPVTQSASRPAWQPNPNTAAQLQQYLGGH